MKEISDIDHQKEHLPIMKSLVILLLLIIFTHHTKGQVNGCQKMTSLWLKKKESLRSMVLNYPSGELLSRDSLLKVIYPEFVTYNPSANTFECNVIQFLYKFNVSRFKSISIGPFQMQLQFIKSVLDRSDLSDIQNKLLTRCKKEGYSALVGNVNELSGYDIQWKVLLLYEKICRKDGTLNSVSDLSKIICLYNTGKIYIAGNTPFSKITCEQKTYLQWANHIDALK